MRNWRARTIAMIWITWTLVLAIAAYAFVHSSFASLNVALPLPTVVGGHRLGATFAAIAAVVWVLLWLYLPPILLTLSWLVARRRREA